MNRLWLTMLLFLVFMLYIDGFAYSLSLYLRRAAKCPLSASVPTRHNLVMLYHRSTSLKSMRLHAQEGSAESDVTADDAFTNEDEEDIPLEDDILDDIVPADSIDNDSSNSTAIDPVAQAVADYESSLYSQVTALENLLRIEKNNLIRWKDRISETGKNGYFIVQAQVNDFSRKRDSDQKQRVKNNKREFIEKMLPLVDAFRNAPLLAPAVTEREQNMHKTYGALLDSILAVFQKYGYKEFEADASEKLNPSKHQISQLEETDEVEDGTILRTVRRGVSDGDGDVLRKALVIVSKKIVKEVADSVDSASVTVGSVDNE